MNCSGICLLRLRFHPGYNFHKYTQSNTDNYTEGKMTILPLVQVNLLVNVNMQLTLLVVLGRQLVKSLLSFLISARNYSSSLA